MKSWLRKIFNSQFPQVKRNVIPPRPPEWKLTVSDLFREMKEGKRDLIGQQEAEWAKDYEVSLIPAHYRFPKTGDLYEAKIDQEISFITLWSAPFTGGGSGIIRAGERIWILSETNEKTAGTYAEAENYKAIEQRMVSDSDRAAISYNGFSLVVKTIDLNEKFRLIETGFSKKRFA